MATKQEAWDRIFYSLDSSMINMITYRLVDSELGVKFNNDTSYIYENVPLSVFGDIVSAPSVGKAFQVAIKDRGYKFRKES